MADFPTALERALKAHYRVRDDYATPVSTWRGLKARMDALERAYGSQKAAAAAVGVAPGTWSGWKSRKTSPRPGSLAKVATGHLALLRALRVARQGYPSQFHVTAIVAMRPPAAAPKSKRATYYNGGSPSARAAHRKFRADQLTVRQVQNVVDAWAAGRPPQNVADVLLDELARAYPGRVAFEGNDVTVTIV